MVEDWIVEAEGLGHRYRGGFGVGPIELRLGRGVVGLVGVNGAGKTTLLRMLATVQSPTAGRLRLAGTAPDSARQLREIRRRLGYVPQSLSLPGLVRVREVLFHAAFLAMVPRRRRAEAVERALAAVDLVGWADRRVGTLSGGTARRVALAQALVHRPDLLLLDEPTVGLDPEQRLVFRSVVSRLGREACVVLSSHLLEDLNVVADRLLVLHEGRLVFDGAVGDLEGLGQAGGRGSRLEEGFWRLVAGQGAR